MKANTLEDIGRLAVAAQIASEAWEKRDRSCATAGKDNQPCWAVTENEHSTTGGMCAFCETSAVLWANRRRTRNTLCAAIIRRLKREARPGAQP